MRPKRIVFVVTVMLSAQSFLKGQLQSCREAGYDVHVLSDEGPELWQIAHTEAVCVHPLKMVRPPNVLEDLSSLKNMLRALASLKPAILNYSTPKAGLLGAICGSLLRVPLRVYVLRGLPLETAQGSRRILLIYLEKLAALLSHRVICISDSLRIEGVRLGLFPYHKSMVIGAGSSNGISPDRYAWRDVQASRAKRAVGLDENTTVVCFFGRIAPDKGVDDLWELVPRLEASFKAVNLLLLGPLDGSEVPTVEDQTAVVNWVGWQDDPSPYLAAADLLLMPSRREGFGNVIIEAALHSTPAVGYNVTGVCDAILDSVTGVLVPSFDVKAFERAVIELLHDRARLEDMGERARIRAETSFSPRRIWDGYIEVYQDMSHGRSAP